MRWGAISLVPARLDMAVRDGHVTASSGWFWRRSAGRSRLDGIRYGSVLARKSQPRCS